MAVLLLSIFVLPFACISEVNRIGSLIRVWNLVGGKRNMGRKSMRKFLDNFTIVLEAEQEEPAKNASKPVWTEFGQINKSMHPV